MDEEQPTPPTTQVSAVKLLEDLYALRDKTDNQIKTIEEILGGHQPAAPSPKRQRAAKKCSTCGEEGHTAPSCPNENRLDKPPSTLLPNTI
jgi:hypothetical protein